MTIAEQLEQRGMQRGEATMLKVILQSRFGKLPPHLVEKIESSDPQTLTSLGIQSQTAKSLDEIFKS